MHIKKIYWPLILFFLSGLLHANAPHAQRIISLAPDITETLFAIGAEKQIVGVIQGSDYPLRAQQIPQVGSYSGIDLEKMVSLHPDLIVVWGNSFARQMQVLQKLGIRVYVTQPQELYDVPKIMRDLGSLTGHEKSAAQQAQQFMQQIATLKQRYQSKKPVRVFYQIGDYSLITINRTSWINQVITLCGGKNVFADTIFSAPEVTWEAVVNANPSVVISDAVNEGWRKPWQRFAEIAAVKNHFLYSINPDLLERASPRLVLGATQVCQVLDMARV